MLLKRRFVLPFLIVLAWTGCRNCRVLELRMSDNELKETLAAVSYPYDITYRSVGERAIRFVKVGHDSLPKLICLHGSPSSLSAWRTLYTDTSFLRHFQVIAIDRPGYGYSGFGKVETDLQKQVALIQGLVDSLTVHQPAILLGSSYGGPVAAQLAMNLPHRIRQLVLLSAAVIPGREKTYWVSYPMTLPILNYLFPPTFVMSSEEKLSHTAQLQTLTAWDRISTDVLLIHGDKDGLVYYDNALRVKQKLTHARSVTLVTLVGKGHSIIFSKPQYLKSLLHQHLKRNP